MDAESNIHAAQKRLDNVLKVTLLGTAFIGAGAVLTTYVPAFHKPVEWVNHHLRSGIDQCARLPKVGSFFSRNPLLQSQDVTQFLSINIFETALTMGVIATIGGVLGITRGTHHAALQPPSGQGRSL